MRMIVHPSSAPSAGRVGSAGCVCASIRMEKRCSNMCTAIPRKPPPVTRTNGRVITESSEITTLCVMARKNGRGMTMAMVFVRSLPTQWKACGQRHAIFCVRFGGSTKNICTAIWPCANIESISNASVPLLSLDSSLSTDQ